MAYPPNTASTGNTAVEMSDLEAGKKDANFTFTSVDSPSERPVLGRRKTTGSVDGLDAPDKLGYDGEEDALTKIGNFFYKVHNFNILTRYALYILPVAALLSIPLILTDTVYADARAGNIRLLGLFIWIEAIWLGLWACKLMAQFVPVLFEAVCGLISTGMRKYSLVLSALEIPISLLFWTIVAYGTVPVIYVFDQDHAGDAWINTLVTVFKAGIIVAAIFLAEKTAVQIVSINYHRKQYDKKIQESKKTIRQLDLMYDTSRALFPEYCHDFEEEDAAIQGNTLADVRQQLAKAGVQTKVFDNMGRVRDKVTAAFGTMASDITGKQVFSTTSAHAIVLEALETQSASKALARRLWLSFVGEGKDALYQRDLTEVLGQSRVEEAEEIFAALDKDGNGDVSLEEMTMLIFSVGDERKNRATSMHDISQAIAVLDNLLSFVVVIVIAFIYATYFSKSFAAKTTQLWTTFTGLAFAIGGTVTEFLSCCIFLFVKHPYDVGDRVDISDIQLIVEHISLMYSVFRRVDSDKTVQIPHQVANTLWIENVSRSRTMKERYNFSVWAGTSSADILALRGELERFVQAPENKRDFQPEVDIELISLGDMKQLELRIEIRHKSNFANELLRSSRRNKFMCELLASMRRVPIDPPGGSAPALGDPANPSYSVAVSDNAAAAFRAKHSEEVDGKRLYPESSGGLSGLVPKAVSSALDTSAGSMITGITGRKGSGLNAGPLYGRRASGESMRTSTESRMSGRAARAKYMQAPR